VKGFSYWLKIYFSKKMDLKELWTKYFGREQRLKNEILEINHSIQVQERNDNLYLTVNNIAVYKFYKAKTAEEVVNSIHNTRLIAEEFKKLEE
jgi:hypothetical protein